MRLGDVKNVTANRGYIKLMLQLKLVVPGSSYFSFISIVSPTPVAASMAIVCGRCTAHLMGMVRIVAGGRTRRLQNVVYFSLH